MTRFKFFGFLLPLAMAGGMALGLMSAPAAAHECSRHGPDSTHKHCDDDGGGTTYTVRLFDGDPINKKDGAFCLTEKGEVFCGQVAVIASPDGELLVAENAVMMVLNRPNDGDVLDKIWDGVFKTCAGLFVDESPPDGGATKLTTNNWRVILTTGKVKGAGPQVDEVRVQFISATPVTPDNALIEVTLQLIARDAFKMDDTRTFLPVDADDPKTYALTDYFIFGSSIKGENPRLQCENTRDDRVELGIVLEIKLTPTPTPTP